MTKFSIKYISVSFLTGILIPLLGFNVCTLRGFAIDLCLLTIFFIILYKPEE